MHLFSFSSSIFYLYLSISLLVRYLYTTKKMGMQSSNSRSNPRKAQDCNPTLLVFPPHTSSRFSLHPLWFYVNHFSRWISINVAPPPISNHFLAPPPQFSIWRLSSPSCLALHVLSRRMMLLRLPSAMVNSLIALGLFTCKLQKLSLHYYRTHNSYRSHCWVCMS